MESGNLIEELIRGRNVDYIGAADLAHARHFVNEQGGPYVAEFPVAISIGIALPNDIVDMLPHRNERAVQVSYRSHAYDVVNRRLDLVASEVTSSLQRGGYRAFPVPAAERMDDERLCAIFSHKLAANLAGLGWIGKSCLLITPEHGPRIRWTTVLTDAPLNTTREPMADGCGDCRECVDVCPVKAFTGKHFSPEEPREVRYAAERCDRYFQGMEAKGQLKVCGMCLYICPFGKGATAAL
jgi:epoxyqueuosine reductase